MGHRQVIPGADYSGVRRALPEANIPPLMDKLLAVWIGAKYNATTGLWTERDEIDTSKDLVATGFASQPVIAAINSNSVFNNKPVVYYTNDSAGTRAKSASANINHSGNKLSISCFYARQSNVAITVQNILWHWQGTNGNTLALEVSGTNSKIAIVINGVRTELAATNTINVGYKIRVEYDGTVSGGQVRVYVNNVIDANGTINGVVISNFIGVFYVASNNIGSAVSRFHGRLACIYMYAKSLTDVEGTLVHNMMTAAYA